MMGARAHRVIQSGRYKARLRASGKVVSGMAEVFLSYASRDREKARALAQFLEARSYSVFWDRTIPPGKSFDEVIEGALREARAVIVLWSPAAVASDWVKAEAEEGATRNQLVPAMIEMVPLPLRFRRIQAADLSAWDFRRSTGEVEQLLSSLGKLLAKDLSSGEAILQPPPRIVEGPGSVVEAPRQVGGIGTPPQPASRPSYLKAFGFHLLLGCGLFYLDGRLKRKWLHLIPPLFLILFFALATAIPPFNGSPRLRGLVFFPALILYALSFVDVGLTCRSRRKSNRNA